MRMRLLVVVAALLVGAAMCSDDDPPEPPAPPTGPDATTVQAGRWFDADTWSTGQVPGPAAHATVQHEVTLDFDATTAGVDIAAGGELEFAAAKPVTLVSTGNVVAVGMLTMTPDDDVTHTVRFADIDETRVVGGGANPLTTDVGLWVMDTGVLAADGADKIAWTYASTLVDAGATTFQVDEADGWRVGDELVVTPTGPPPDTSSFDRTRITAVDGTTVTVDPPVARAHPEVDGRWNAEVLNLTRNVVIEGTPAGRAHVFIHNTVPTVQQIADVEIREVGVSNKVGRYGLHFHLGGDNNRGSTVDRVVVHDADEHAFVPHATHGITFTDTVAYKTLEEPYWWDNPSSTTNPDPAFITSNDITFDGAVAADTDHDKASTLKDIGPNSGFVLCKGTGNKIVNSVAVGARSGQVVGGGGYHWPATCSAFTDSTWVFDNNVAHNNSPGGTYVWQNTDTRHVIDNFVAYHNAITGFEHGSYTNAYRYNGVTVFGNGESGIRLTAGLSGSPAPDTTRQSFTDVHISGSQVGLLRRVSSLPHTIPSLWQNCTIDGPVVLEENGPDRNTVLQDFVNCDLEPDDFRIPPDLPNLTLIRVQRQDGTAFQIDQRGTVSTIPTFFDPTGDIGFPRADITTPGRGQGTPTLSGTSTVEASATDNVGVVKVEFFVDRTLLGTDTNGPYVATFDSTSVPNGDHTLYARAWDAAGNYQVGRFMAVVVNN